jgi:hypothetical protein
MSRLPLPKCVRRTDHPQAGNHQSWDLLPAVGTINPGKAGTPGPEGMLSTQGKEVMLYLLVRRLAASMKMQGVEPHDIPHPTTPPLDYARSVGLSAPFAGGVRLSDRVACPSLDCLHPGPPR